ncbi:alcohol dehydrogenase catalytic domain-containing protein [Actinomadura sp. NAK00032]|uniref:zinc-dependent alcohol dehydrogenase n=1 Tax=Actinomadura sp. NAK00032 TaxID=2742128 RepID=UPI00159156F6|nr:zinc-binding dehydrogenase [Actinomadura sp. NAK00032]QKW33052.1 alcohol dehydrogenase catalytic domain-containing protein [Actinomadura sp. NAK00032]
MTRAGAARAVLQRAPRTLDLVELPLPDVGPDDALLAVEACGICGTDVEEYSGALLDTIGPTSPFVPGHEPVGRIAAIGARAAVRWGLAEGDRVAVEPALPCGACRDCRTGRYVLCAGWEHFPMSYGFVPAKIPPALWGGFADRMYLHPNSVLHRLPDAVDPAVAATFNALAAGVEWAVEVPGTRAGDCVVVLGAGQRGLACVLAARAAGADPVIVTGLAADRHKLDLALELGATAAVVADGGGVPERIRALTGGVPVDVVVDVASGDPTTVLDAMAIVRPGGTVVLAGLKNGRPVPGFTSDDVVLKGLRVQGVRAAGHASFRRAVALIAAGDRPLHRLVTHTFALPDAAQAIETLAAPGGGPNGAVSVVITPDPVPPPPPHP